MPDWACACVVALVQLARIRVHGFSAREVAVVRRLYLADMERAYIERDQALSDGLRAEYVQVSIPCHVTASSQKGATRSRVEDWGGTCSVPTPPEGWTGMGPSRHRRLWRPACGP